MHINSSQLDSPRLPKTITTLRAQLTQLTHTLAHLGRDLVEEERWQPPHVPRKNETGYTLFGQTFRVSDGSEILIEILRHFAEFDPTFPERYSVAVRGLGRIRPYVTRTRESLYPGKPHLLSQTAEFAPGWFVGINEGNEKKVKLIRLACDVLNLRWNQDLEVHMP